MTVDEMAEKIAGAVVRTGGSTSFVEVVRFVGEEATGDFAVRVRPDLFLLVGISEKFGQALELAKKQYGVEYRMSTQSVYLLDGQMIDLPVATRPSLTKKYKEPHWLPVTLHFKNGNESPYLTRQVLKEQLRDAGR